MLRSRGICLFRQALTSLNSKTRVQVSQAVRHSHAWSYRVGAPPHSKATRYTAEVVGAFMWWWILWHLWHEHEHVTGEFPYPNPSKWTDAELGIPPDDEE